MTKLKTFLIALTAIGILALEFSNCSTASAQSRGFDLKAFLQRIDKNGNGVVEPSEISDGRTKKFLERSGVDVSQPITISGVTAKVAKSKRDRSDRLSKSKASQGVPGFTVTDKKEEKTTGFGISDAERKPAEKASQTKHSDDTKRQVDRVLATYDRNKNGSMEPDEIKRARWGSPTPEESDLNKDGSLSRGELLTRYSDREKGSSRRTSSSRGRSTRDQSSRDKEKSTSRDRSRRDRSPVSTSKGRESSSSTPKPVTSSRKVSDSYKKYVDGLFQTYDKDGDGKLSKDEIGKMRRKPGDADSDGDDFISKDELVEWYSSKTKKRSSSTSSDSSSTKKRESSRSTRSRRSGGSSRSSSGSSALSDLDSNKNGQIELSEFSDDWNDDVVEEFYKKDKDHDGVITATEWNGG